MTPVTAQASPLKAGDTVSYTVYSDSATGNEISTYDGFNRPVYASTLYSSNRRGMYVRTFSFKVTATRPYLAIGITTPGSIAGCTAMINSKVYSRDDQRGYHAHALCN